MTKPNADEKTCPFCAETIKAAAVKCRYCQSDLVGSDEPQSPNASPPSPVAEDRTGGLARDTRTGVRLDKDSVREPDQAAVAEARGGIPFLASARLLGILVALCLVLSGVAGYAWWRSENPSEGKAPDGVITSSSARDAGMTAAVQLTQKVLSYDWKTLDADMKAAEAVLAPTFRAEYVKTMDKVKPQTVKNQVTLKASAVATSIISASDKKVQALVFVNQVTTAKGAGNQRLDQNRVRVTLTRDGGDWRVSKMDAF